MRGRHRRRSKIRAATVWIIYTVAALFSIIVVLILYTELHGS